MTAPAQTTSARPLRVSFAQLVASPTKFKGKKVSVVAYFDQIQSHSPFICADAYAAKTLTVGEDKPTIFINLKRQQLTDPSIKVIDRGYVRIVGKFEYKNIDSKVVESSKKDGGRVIVQTKTGFGWMGVFSMQITNITEFMPVEHRNGAK
jgi:hypothetical protein